MQTIRNKKNALPAGGPSGHKEENNFHPHYTLEGNGVSIDGGLVYVEDPAELAEKYELTARFYSLLAEQARIILALEKMG